MLYIALTENRQISRHIGEDMPHWLANEVLEVQADSDELMHILNNMEQLPRHKTRRVQNWFGDDAKFIVANW